MKIIDWVTFGIAVWGAVVASILGYLRIREHRRDLDIHLEWKAFYEKCNLIIVNKGQRPITIKRVIVRSPEDGWAGFSVLEDEKDKELSYKLEYGGEVTLLLTDEVAKGVYYGNFETLIYDAEGNEYRPTWKRVWSPRYEDYQDYEKIKYPKTKISLWERIKIKIHNYRVGREAYKELERSRFFDENTSEDN